MGKSEEERINELIGSVRSVSGLKYQRPEDRTKEYYERLTKDSDALTYLLKERGFELRTIEHFKLGLSEKNLISIPIYKDKELIDYKFRTVPPAEKGFARTPNSETWIFNGDDGIKIGKKMNEIIVLEGEIDLMTLWQNGFENVISLVGGAQSIGSWINELNDIKVIYVCLDNDKVGKDAAKNLADRLGVERCVNVVLPEKDPNDFFKKYTKEDFENVLNNSDKFPIEDVSRIEELLKEIKNNPLGEKDFKFRFGQLDKITGGFNRTNLIVLAGDTGHGKSTLSLNMAINMCPFTPVMYIPLEDNPTYIARRTLNMMSGMEVSKLSEEEWIDLENRVIGFPFYIYLGREKFNLSVFKEMVERGKKIYNINIFILDHLHFLAKRGKDPVEELGFIMMDLVTICRQFNISIIVLAHIRKKSGFGNAAEYKEMPHIDSLKGSSCLKQDAHMVFMIYQKRLEMTGKTILQLSVQKNREGGVTTKPLEFDYDLESGIISEQI